MMTFSFSPLSLSKRALVACFIGTLLYAFLGWVPQAKGDTTTWTWDNGAGTSLWDSSTDQNNWNPNTTPSTTAAGYTPTVIFDSTYVTTNQTLTVQNGSKILNNLYISGPLSYTLNPLDGSNNSPNKNPILTFSSGTAGGISTIQVSSNSKGSANHTINLRISANNDLQILQSTNKTLNLNQSVTFGSNTLTINTSGTSTVQVNESIIGTGTFIKAGTGTVSLNALSSTFTGKVVVNGGSLVLNVNSGGQKALATVSQVIVNSGGTVVLGNNNQINPLASMQLSGGTFNTQGYSQNLATLTYTSNSTINLGTGNLTLASLINSNGAILTVTGLNSANSQLVVTTSVSSTALADIYFADQGVLGGTQLLTGQIIPNRQVAPEASTYLLGFLLIGNIAFYTYCHFNLAKSTGLPYKH